ncbi:30S ribosomal protein S7 [Candidatus Uhrbacteria bacterium RIFCSPLOWO2_12_FULL_46_10]|uniref:Small ribosomal subunit protein uS7 n=1 Tax=Candidatus Uhrbacteria bacterium RIFCSPLOWO2_01_FULL_47_25 TaxID=1802402 RepID=A0A1F7URH5_9BACT|nr:MAG: 30S ribosomal protein S7 [Candidatus Uhrbacteria bacterium RIFCSPHIGHO2_02_FULL_47_29]OGL76495.1 MAG: 30S ribosomal protein S7 [Candidatus Uhrbacteria bacterium RIFCSPHIGHO2_12_FULL_46_13]OGL80881.1 MAG: 30S ribosomal protein S7 [Candidatus Uhrbacteria bacterium RIFCSPLOWO2_01_FULL_47_25]OGL84547.1 MAG: 30S ribosomal protein S7 [Candidatus Uhrbacteria bacterium RIFCSPLOWO2_02_FULL_46_19]OGL91072.1 MAG: 30S ribosomal protein S7 [Candidatus Uhrbacteria bacterium RIFCSPLOWO2_12_FULL_46_10]
MRGKRAVKRAIQPDQKYRSTDLAKFINYVMERGKKTVAQKVVYGMLDIVAEKTKLNPLEVFETAIKNVSPVVEVRSRRVGGANYQIPVPVRPERRMMLSYRWIIEAAAGAKGRPMKEKLAAEILSAANNEGAAIKKKMDVHRMAEANRAFAHFARY